MIKIMCIGGMTCPHCYARVEQALNSMDGVSARVNVANKAATIDCTKPVSDIDLIRVVQKAGYKVESLR